MKLSSGEYLITDKNVTGFSWNEERMAKRDHAVPFNLEDELRRREANYSKALVPFKSHVVEDDLLITGRNPGSTHAVGKTVVKELEQLSREAPTPQAP